MGKRERELAALLKLSSLCLVTVSVLRLFHTVPWVGLQCVTLVYPVTYFFSVLGPILPTSISMTSVPQRNTFFL